MNKILIVPAVIGLLAVPSFALAHSGVGVKTTAHVASQSRVDADDNAAVPAVPATPATPSTPATPAIPAIPATPAVPAVGHDSDNVTGHVETEAETSTDNSGHHANVSVSADDHSVRVGSTINE